MRIVAGKHRGAILETPEGRDTRPTSERARESLFNILENGKHSPGLNDARVADIFAGTGALGLEALSRGAAHCVFAENDRKAIGALKRNIAKLDFLENTRILEGSALNLPQNRGAPVDIAILDPPYGQDLLHPALNRLFSGGWLSSATLIVVQFHPKERFVPDERFSVLDERKYGAARFMFMEATP